MEYYTRAEGGVCRHSTEKQACRRYFTSRWNKHNKQRSPYSFFFFVSTCQICVTKGYSLHFYLKNLTVTKHVCLLVASEFSWLIIYYPVLNRRGGEGHSFTALAKKYPQISFINTPLPCFLNIFPNIFTFNCSFSICSTTYPAFISNILMLPLKWKYLFCQFSHMGSFNYFLM